MGAMNIFSDLFGIFRQRGLVIKVKEGRSLAGFVLSALLFSILSGLLYGFSMGIGLGIETAVKDAVKVGLVVTLSALFAIPVFWVAYRLLGREESFAQVSSVPLTLTATTAVLLAVTAPVVFMLSIMAGFSPDAVYIHIVIVDVALLIGLYLAGTLLYHGFSEQRRLVVPSVVGFLIMFVILLVLVSFLSPFLAPSSTFSVGTDRLKYGLGIGVQPKVTAALAAATSANQVSYRFQTTNENGDLTRDYAVTRLGENYLVEVKSHAVSGEASQVDRHIWVLEGKTYTDFDQGRVTRVGAEEVQSFLGPALPPAVFSLPAEFDTASWRAFETNGRYNINGVSPSQAQAVLSLEGANGRLAALTLGSATRSIHAETKVSDVSAAVLDQSALEASLNQAIILGSIDRSDASMQDYVQGEAFFALRYPRTWHSGSWNAGERRVTFAQACEYKDGCPELLVSVYDLKEGFGAQQYAEELARSLELQPEYREIKIGTIDLGQPGVAVVEYLYDRTSKGTLVTVQHIEYIFVGQVSRYHLDFSNPQETFETYRELFQEIASMFTYLVKSPE
jgi:uncharacterized membrane protein (DUF485 family)